MKLFNNEFINIIYLINLYIKKYFTYKIQKKFFLLFIFLFIF